MRPPVRHPGEVVAVMARILPENERALAPFRAEIDHIDAQIVELLARRFEVVKHVHRHQAGGGPRGSPTRAGRGRLEKVMAQAEIKGVPPELAEKLWRVLIDWVLPTRTSGWVALKAPPNPCMAYVTAFTVLSRTAPRSGLPRPMGGSRDAASALHCRPAAASACCWRSPRRPPLPPAFRPAA